jgi:hypothetical protein
LQHEELVVWDLPRHLFCLGLFGGNPSDLVADCPLVKAGMLGSAYEKMKLFVYSLTATATWYPNYST